MQEDVTWSAIYIFCSPRLLRHTSSLRCHANNCVVSLCRLMWATSYERWDFSGTAWFRPRSVSKFKGKKNRSQTPDVSFVSLLSGPVSLLLQSLAGGFTGHFTATRQPMATGKSTGPQSSLSVFHPLVRPFAKHTLCSPSLHWRVTPDSWAVVSDSFQDKKKKTNKNKTLYFSVFILCIEA